MKIANVHYLYKLGRKLYRSEHKKTAKLIRLYMRIVCTCDIPFEADTDDSVHFNHNGFGIVINPLCKIGQGTDIQHSVTHGELRGDVPTIGRNVYIGAGSVVLSDVPQNATAVGNPTKIIRNE